MSALAGKGVSGPHTLFSTPESTHRRFDGSAWHGHLRDHSDESAVLIDRDETVLALAIPDLVNDQDRPGRAADRGRNVFAHLVEPRSIVNQSERLQPVGRVLDPRG